MLRVGLLATTALVVSTFANAGSADLILDLGYAKYLGSHNAQSDTNSWSGIYYAQAPVGDLRWRPPQPIEYNNSYVDQGAINATSFGPSCVQASPTWQGPSTGPPAGQEDCLLLNILAPAHPQSIFVPIIIYIHGGGYVQGDSKISPDELLIQSNGSFALVSIQYRLGLYGFLSNSEVVRDGIANAGLVDQRAAIFWVWRYAHTFGGDRSKITLWGGSAGGGSVTAQMMLYGGDPNPPFRAAIAEYPWWQNYHNVTTYEGQYGYLLKLTGCADLPCLRNLSEASLSAVQQKVFDTAYGDGAYGFGDFYFGPAVDGSIIHDLPSREFAAGHFSKVPLLVDRDGYEGVVFSNTSVSTQEEELADLQRLWPAANQSFFTGLYNVYGLSDFNSTFYHRAQIFGDAFVDCPTEWIASAVADRGLPVYKLLFDAGTELHAATQGYLTTRDDENGTYMFNRTIGTYMRDWWISFVTDLNPNTLIYAGREKPYWPVYNDQTTFDNGGFNVMVLNFTSIGVNKDYDASPRCDFLHGQQAVLFN